MSVPTSCKVLVVGGGPAGSYCASVLAREGISTVLLEADKFPRYHVGESLLPSIRHFLKFIDADKDFAAHGFRIKKGATFKLNNTHPTAYTDFVAAGGPDGYAYNVLRSESDDLLFRHAGKCGAKIFDQIKVDDIEFAPSGLSPSDSLPDPGRPVAATWQNKATKFSGRIEFEYLVDATGRAGIMSTKYLKNRKMNDGRQLKNVASWGYWDNAADFAVGTPIQGTPYFECLGDASGWVWFIPLHNGKTSVGVVRNQDTSTAVKREKGLDSKGLYLESIKSTPQIQSLLAKATLGSELKSAQDWSYSAPAYSSPYCRIVGDAGCFIDPFFSSGVHLAMVGGLSAAVTICAALKNQCSEISAAEWHTKKIAESYTRFLLVVSSALKQIRHQDEPVLSDFDEKTFDRAFAHFRPIIQGRTEMGQLSQAEISKTVDFCFSSFAPIDKADKDLVLTKMRELGIEDPSAIGSDKYQKGIKELESLLSVEQMNIVHSLRGRQMLKSSEWLDLEDFGSDVIDGLTPTMVRGQLGLSVPTKKAQFRDVYGTLSGENLTGHALHGTSPGDLAKFGNGANNGKKKNDDGYGLSSTIDHVDTLRGINAASEMEEGTRLRMQERLLDLAEDTETPNDTMLRLFGSTLEIAMVQTAIKLNLFRRFTESSVPLSTKMLSTSLKVEPDLMARILRYLASVRFISEVGEGQFNISGPVYQALPAYLEEIKYQSPSGGYLAWNKAYGTDQPFFDWVREHPDELDWFSKLMSVPRNGDWLDVFDIDQAAKSATGSSNKPVFVDVGGGLGHQSARLVNRFPQLKGHVVHQDKDTTIQLAGKLEGVDSRAHDFFTPQTVKNADFYYLRTVLHDWTDEDCVRILENLRPAMGSGSKILIDEMVLPNQGVHRYPAVLDMHMYVMLGAKERTEAQWAKVLDAAGLRLCEVKLYSPVMRHAVIVAEKK
ncbi:uncharacterized protein PG998_006019 [Apiospora kogelbergensis]|uniref:uncharacterized protein n=1 Tax=Apiospora kogelbergensis TaxID=1337665 RepID=UPI0031316138